MLRISQSRKIGLNSIHHLVVCYASLNQVISLPWFFSMSACSNKFQPFFIIAFKTLLKKSFCIHLIQIQTILI